MAQAPEANHECVVCSKRLEIGSDTLCCLYKGCFRVYCKRSHAEINHENADHEAVLGTYDDLTDNALALALHDALTLTAYEEQKVSAAAGLVGAVMTAATIGSDCLPTYGTACTAAIVFLAQSSFYLFEYKQGRISKEYLKSKVSALGRTAVASSVGAAVGGALGSMTGNPSVAMMTASVGGAVSGYMFGGHLSGDAQINEAWRVLKADAVADKLDKAIDLYFPGERTDDLEFVNSLTPAKITSKYYRLARVHHSNRETGDDKAFQSIYEHYQVLLVFVKARNEEASTHMKTS